MSSLNAQKDLQGHGYWRSLEQLADTPEYRDFLHREFQHGASEMRGEVTRRHFLTLMGASIALAGLAGCRKPVEKILPYVTAPENVIPGIPKYFATTMPLGITAYGVVVETHEGRPTKIEGNELHPSTRGASNAIVQASVLGLYDPDRSQRVIERGVERQWTNFETYWRKLETEFAANQGTGLAVISESFSSPTLVRLARAFRNKFPRASWVVYEPVSDENVFAGIHTATGRRLQPRYLFENADVILALDSDFLCCYSEDVSASLGFADGRRLTDERDTMNRLYVVEGIYSLTGSMADHRLRLPSSRIAEFTAALAKELRRQGLNIAVADQLQSTSSDTIDADWVRVVASDLLKSRGRGLVTAGARQPSAVHSLVYAINEALDNNGATVIYRDADDLELPDTTAFKSVVEKMGSGEITAVVLLGGNPVYNGPADLNFRSALAKVPNSIHLSLHRDETSRLCTWHLPQTHYLESWGDARAVDGSLSVIQPMIEPLYGGRSAIEVVQMLVTGENRRGYEIVRETWQTIIRSDFESGWRRVLHDGILAGSAAPAVRPAPSVSVVSNAVNEVLALDKREEGLEVIFHRSPYLSDGRFANNGWLQETPSPITKLTWDNAALMSYATAKANQVTNGDLVSLNYRGRALEVPVWIVPGMADGCVALELGYGREFAGRVGNGVGSDAYRLRVSDAASFGGGATITRLNRKYAFSCAQDHGSMEGRPLVREATLAEYREHPTFARDMVEHPPLKSLFREHSYEEGYQWGMTIDLNACTGCGACSVACQSENNIPIVGKAQVAHGREMHWIRVDRYFAGDLDEPEIVHQPVTCQHCENAPCEQVCPVAATVHDKEGLNVMVYNRCIGTRYCSNNCPYKVRRFNFFNYTKDTPEIVRMAMNPDVTVRFRGVMEKCTFCVQRISEARINAKLESREVRDGEVTTACQQVCPTEAIVFGNINDSESRVSKLRTQNRGYEILSELNVRPRITYLARIRNPHPELAGRRKPVEVHG